MIPHSRPLFNTTFEAAVQAVVTSGHTAMGEQARLLEQTVIQQIGCQNAVAVDSGSSAIMLAIRALAMQKNIQYIGIPAYACASLLFAVRAAGCTPVCMDCTPDLRLDMDKAWALSSQLDAVVLVHPFGMLEPMVKESWHCPVIEDIAQAAGATLDGKPAGSFGDIAITSFYATKPWGGAYGGMVMASTKHCEQIRHMCNPDTDDFSQGYVGHHQLSDVHASLALCRLQGFQAEMQQRKQHMQWLDEHLPSSYVQSIPHRSDGNAFRYIIRTHGEAEKHIQNLRKHGIAACQPVQKPLHLATGEVCNGAQQAWQDCISLPLLPTMTTDEYQQYEKGLKACFNY